MNEELKQKLAEALAVSREQTERPNWVTRQINKIRVFNILNEEKNLMKETGGIVDAYNTFIKKPGEKGYTATKLDDFYHKHGMYRAAQLGPDAAEYALWLGRQKENLYDYPRKYLFTKSSSEQIKADRQKDLTNNTKAVIMALENPGVPVEQMIPHQGTTAGDFDRRYRGKWVK